MTDSMMEALVWSFEVAEAGFSTTSSRTEDGRSDQGEALSPTEVDGGVQHSPYVLVNRLGVPVFYRTDSAASAAFLVSRYLSTRNLAIVTINRSFTRLL